MYGTDGLVGQGTQRSRVTARHPEHLMLSSMRWLAARSRSGPSTKPTMIESRSEARVTRSQACWSHATEAECRSDALPSRQPGRRDRPRGAAWAHGRPVLGAEG